MGALVGDQNGVTGKWFFLFGNKWMPKGKVEEPSEKLQSGCSGHCPEIEQWSFQSGDSPLASQDFIKKTGALRHWIVILPLGRNTSHTQAGLIFSCHQAQGLGGLDMLSYQYHFSSILKIALAISFLGSWSHSGDRPGSQASKTAEHPWINASAAGGRSTQTVIRGSSWWPL